MSRLIEFIKRIFSKKILVLEKAKISTDEEYLNQKENFLNSIKVENHDDSILLLQRKIENELLDESKLTVEQVVKIKRLYCNQIVDLMNSIKKLRMFKD